MGYGGCEPRVEGIVQYYENEKHVGGQYLNQKHYLCIKKRKRKKKEKKK